MMRFLFILFSLLVVVPAYAAGDAEKIAQIEELKTRHTEVETVLSDHKEEAQRLANIGYGGPVLRQDLKILAGNIAKLIEELASLRRQLEALTVSQVQEIKLSEFTIFGRLEQSGEEIVAPLLAGQRVKFVATAPYASEYPPRRRGLTWKFLSPDNRELFSRSCNYDEQGQPIPGSAAGCDPQRRANYWATFILEIKDIESGQYRVSLRHYLLDSPEISVSAHQDFKVQSQRVGLAPLKIEGAMVGGGAISKAVTAGDSVMFMAVASLADSEEELAVRRSLTWRLSSPDGMEIFSRTCRYAEDGALLQGSNQQCAGQSGSDYQAQLKYTLKNMKSGRYTISLTHALLDNPEISVSDRFMLPFQGQEIKLSEFKIVGFMHGGGEIHGAVSDGDQLIFEAEVPHPEFEPAVMSELIWQFFDANGNEKSKLRKRSQVAESGKKVKYKYGPIRVNAASLKNGVYKVSLTHWLYDNPEVSKQDVYSFKLLLPLRIKGMRMVSHLDETKHKTTFYSHEQPIAVLSYEMAEGINQAEVMFTLKGGGEILSQKGGVQKRKEGEQGMILKRATMRYKKGRVKAGSVAEVEVVVTSGNGQAQHASQSFRVEDFKISVQLPSSLEAEESSSYSISVPDSFQAPYTVDLSPSGKILLSASSTGSLSGKVTAMGRDTASTARVKVKVKVTDSEGRTGVATGTIQIKAKPEEKETASTDDKNSPPRKPPDFNQIGEVLSIIGPIIGQMGGGDPTLGGLMQGFPSGGVTPPSSSSSGGTSGCKVPSRYRIPGDALMSVQVNSINGPIYNVTLYPLESGGSGNYYTKKNISKVVGQGKFGPGCSVVRHGSWYFYNTSGRMIKGGTFVNDVEQ